MTFNGRLLQEELDRRILEMMREILNLRDKVDKLIAFRHIMSPYTFYECKEHGVYGIRSPNVNECKMCKRLKM